MSETDSGNPLKVQEQYHSQFMLSTKSYRDNNNFMRINTGVNYNERFWAKLGSFRYRFLDFV